MHTSLILTFGSSIQKRRARTDIKMCRASPTCITCHHAQVHRHYVALTCSRATSSPRSFIFVIRLIEIAQQRWMQAAKLPGLTILRPPASQVRACALRALRTRAPSICCDTIERRGRHVLLPVRRREGRQLWLRARKLLDFAEAAGRTDASSCLRRRDGRVGGRHATRCVFGSGCDNRGLLLGPFAQSLLSCCLTLLGHRRRFCHLLCLARLSCLGVLLGLGLGRRSRTQTRSRRC